MAIFQTYTVRPGDTLGKIARAFATTDKELQRLNAIRNRNLIRSGQELRIRQVSEVYHRAQKGDQVTAIAAAHGVPAAAVAAANAVPEGKRLAGGDRIVVPVSAPPQTASSVSPVKPLGSLSRRYEVGARGPETVSTGKGDAGGVSYGTYQLASKLGRPAQFLAAEGKRWADRFAGTTEGSPEFSAVWKAVARKEPVSFDAAQHAFIERTHFAVQMAFIAAQTGADMAARSAALHNVIWSCAVQHGPKGKIVCEAMKQVTLKPAEGGYDRALIDAIYAERGRRGADGRLVHFGKNSIDVQEGVANRFRLERNDAIALLDAEQAKRTIVAAVIDESKGSDALLRRVAANMSDEDAYRLMEKYGDDEARGDFMAGRKVCVALRRPTNWKLHEKGKYDDPMLLVWREGQRVKVERFWCTTEPAGAYAFGHQRAGKGSSVDINRDGKADLGRLCPGTYHFNAENHPHLGKIYKARDIQVVERDANHDGNFTATLAGSADRIDTSGAGRTMYIHKGATTFTASAGCQTLAPNLFARFLGRLAGQSPLSYLLINADQ